MPFNDHKEKRTLTPLKAQAMLAKYGTHISLENAAVMLDFLYKLSNLSVSEAIRRAKQNVKPKKQKS